MCVETKPIAEFCISSTNKNNGTVYIKHLCKKCDSIQRELRGYRTWAQKIIIDPLLPQKNSLRRRNARKDPNKNGKHIVEDSRRTDRKKGLQNNLDEDWVNQIISLGCCYCGETSLRISLDRIDNNIGHVKTNVVPACIRCNYTRKNMPYAAWILLVPAMKAAREKGLFGEWTGRGRSVS
jgi:hypothetical protein